MKTEKAEKLVANLHNKTEYVIHIIHLKQALNHGLVLKKVYKGIKFNQNGWAKLWIDMNTDLRRKKWFGKRFFQVDEWFSFWKKLWKMLENIEILNLS